MIHLFYRYCTIVGICEAYKRFQNKIYRISNINKDAQPFQINLKLFGLHLNYQEVYYNDVTTITKDRF